MSSGETIFHLAIPDDWEEARPSGSYTMSTRGRTLADEGFIHCARQDQVQGVANRFYADVAELVVLTIDPERIGSPIRDEPPAPGSSELFPHIYGPLPTHAVVDASPWTRSGQSWSWNPPTD